MSTSRRSTTGCSSCKIGKAGNNLVDTVEVDVSSTSSAPPDSNNSTVLGDSLPPDIRSHETYTNSSPAGLPSAQSPTSIPQLVSSHPDINPFASLPLLPGQPSIEPSTRFAIVDNEDINGGDDPEGARVSLCQTLLVDKNAKDNTLPFTLQCYSQWAIANFFKPLKVVHIMREQVIAQFSSEQTRVKTILTANVMEMLAKKFVIDGARKSILNHLVLGVRKSVSSFVNIPPPFAIELDRQNAIRILDSILEIHSLQLPTEPISDSLQLLECAAPVFWRACFEPPGQPVNRPNALMNPSVNIRYFVAIDVMTSITLSRPTHFRYEVPFSLELLEQIYFWQLQGNYGLQWLFGLPDQFLILFAWINQLSETPGASENLQLIAWIENLLPQVKIAVEESGDPALRIGRMVVRESWRLSLLLYLYMVLCKADAYDSRVIRAQKSYMRLVRGVKPGRNPDLFLVISMAIAGVATTKERDRSALRQRMMNVAKCVQRGSLIYYAILRLEDVWGRTRNEGRPVVWADLRIPDFTLIDS